MNFFLPGRKYSENRTFFKRRRGSNFGVPPSNVTRECHPPVAGVRFHTLQRRVVDGSVSGFHDVLIRIGDDVAGELVASNDQWYLTDKYEILSQHLPNETHQNIRLEKDNERCSANKKENEEVAGGSKRIVHGEYGDDDSRLE